MPETGRCELCGRSDVELTRHHLLPRTRHAKLREHIDIEELRGRIAMLCRGCHRQIHRTFTERELAEEWNSIERLRSHPGIAKFIGWVRRRPPGLRIRGMVVLLALAAASGCERQDRTRARTVPAEPKFQLLDRRETQIIDQLNAARTDPRTYAQVLASRRRWYDGRLLRLPGETPIRTTEGLAALDEAVRVLRAAPVAPAVAASEELTRAASDHVRDIGRKGTVTHQDSDDSSPRDRVRRYADGVRTVAEVISFGSDEAEAVIIDLLVDDGVRNRGHRKILLDPAYRLAGAACGPHATYRTVCVMDLADSLGSR